LSWVGVFQGYAISNPYPYPLYPYPQLWWVFKPLTITKQDMVDLEKEIENPPVYEALSADIRVERNLDLEEIPLVFSQFPIFLEADAAADAVLCAGSWLPRPPADYVQPPELHCSLPPGA